MTVYKLCGTRKDERPHFERTRKPEGELKKGEYRYQKDSNAPITAYRKDVGCDIEGFSINKVLVDDGEYEGKKTRAFTLFATYNDRSDIYNLGGSMAAESVVFTICSLLGPAKVEEIFLKYLPEGTVLENPIALNRTFTQEQIDAADWHLSTYADKGYAKLSLKKCGDKVPWALSADEKKLLIKETNWEGQNLKSYEQLNKCLNELVDEVNKILPRGNYSGGKNGLEDDDDDYVPSNGGTSESSGDGLGFMDDPSEGSADV